MSSMIIDGDGAVSDGRVQSRALGSSRSTDMRDAGERPSRHARLAVALAVWLAAGCGGEDPASSPMFERWRTPSSFRGFDINYFYYESGIKSADDFRALAATGATLAQIQSNEGTVDWAAPYGPSADGVKALDDMVAWCGEAKLCYVLAEWLRARELVEQRQGAKFERVFVMGFSNGAYYASSLALRDKLPVDGYAVFAGGSGPDHQRRAAWTGTHRAAVFVGITSKDRTASDARKLARLLADLGWPHRAEERPVGLAVADAHLDHALAYLRQAPARAAAQP
jgi:predicted esterase